MMAREQNIQGNSLICQNPELLPVCYKDGVPFSRIFASIISSSTAKAAVVLASLKLVEEESVDNWTAIYLGADFLKTMNYSTQKVWRQRKS